MYPSALSVKVVFLPVFVDKLGISTVYTVGKTVEEYCVEVLQKLVKYSPIVISLFCSMLSPVLFFESKREVITMPDEKTVDKGPVAEEARPAVRPFDPMTDGAYTSRRGAHVDFDRVMDRNIHRKKK